MKTDQFGMVLSGGDGGDSCHRMYTIFLRLKILSAIDPKNPIIQQALSQISDSHTVRCLLEPMENGIYVRNPDPNAWYSDPRNVSRDQLTPVICFNALTPDSKGAQLRLLKACLKRAMFAQNIYPNWVDPRKMTAEELKKTKKMPDFLNFELWGVFARTWIKSLWFPLALPLVILGDLSLLLSAIIKVAAPLSKDGTLKFHLPGPNDVDDDNINNVIMATQYVFPTPLSYLARKIYKTFRGKNNGNIELGEKSSIMGAIAWYNRNDSPELTEMARPIVDRY